MNKTLYEGDKLLIKKSGEIRFGNVLVFSKNQNTYVKRLVGLPGDTVQIIHRILYINHRKITEEYVNLGPNTLLAGRSNPNIMGHYGINWSIENFGPYVVPKKGNKIILDSKNFNIYKNLLNRELKSSVNRARMLNHSYVFLNNYYFMLGDNRSFSEDSRMYGPVVKENIVGIAKYVLYSKKKLWDRVLTKI